MDLKDKGIVYIAVNKLWVKEALYSAKTVKEKCKNLPITLFTDKIIKSKHINNLEIIPHPEGRRFKFLYLDKSPYEYSLFLDSDTQVICDILEVFEILDKFDIALCKDICRTSEDVAEKVKEYAKIPYSFCGFNSGVILYKMSEKVKNFIKLWKNLYYEYEKLGILQDQASLRTALWNSNLKMYVLPDEYNLQRQNKREKMFKNIKPRIIHGRKFFEKSKSYISNNYKMT